MVEQRIFGHFRLVHIQQTKMIHQHTYCMVRLSFVINSLMSPSMVLEYR